MRRILLSLLLVVSWIGQASAHHTRDHLMLMTGRDDVMAGMRQGAAGDMFWLVWLLVFVVLVLGLVRWWRGRHDA